MRLEDWKKITYFDAEFTQNLPTHAEHIQKNVLHMLCMRLHFLAHAQHALTVTQAAVVQAAALTPEQAKARMTAIT
jgi:hypothetical protein